MCLKYWEDSILDSYKQKKVQFFRLKITADFRSISRKKFKCNILPFFRIPTCQFLSITCTVFLPFLAGISNGLSFGNAVDGTTKLMAESLVIGISRQINITFQNFLWLLEKPSWWDIKKWDTYELFSSMESIFVKILHSN